MIFVLRLFAIVCCWMGVTGYAQSQLSVLEREINQFVNAVRPSIVTISSRVSVAQFQHEKPDSYQHEDFESEPPMITNVGSGIIIHKSGYIVTKPSVVKNASHIFVHFTDERMLEANLIGIDRREEVALLRIDGSEFNTPAIGFPDALMPGSWMILVGNSMGMSSAVSMGNVQAILPDKKLQVSAIVSPGNNGAAVLNSSGQLVGMVAGKLVLSSNPQASASAESALVVPIDRLLKSCDDIIKSYADSHGWLGITVSPYDHRYPKVVELKSNSPAKKAGLKMNDIIHAVNGQELTDYIGLRNIIRKIKPEEKVVFGIIRQDEPHTVQMFAGMLPERDAFEANQDEKGQPEIELNKKETSKPDLQQRLLKMENRIIDLERKLQIKDNN